MYPKRPEGPLFSLLKWHGLVIHPFPSRMGRCCIFLVNYSWIGKFSIPMDPKWEFKLKLFVFCIPCKSSWPLKRIDPWNCWSNIPTKKEGVFSKQKTFNKYLEPQTTIHKWMFGEFQPFSIIIFYNYKEFGIIQLKQPLKNGYLWVITPKNP